MYNRNNTYAMMGNQHVSQQQQLQQQSQMLQGMRNIQIQNLSKAYPQMTLQKKNEQVEEYKVPFKLEVSDNPLWMKVELPQDFPLARPTIRVMSRVSHPHVEPNTYVYNGPAIAKWTEMSSLVQAFQEIQQEFRKNPPIPVNWQGPTHLPQPQQPGAQKQQYQPEIVTLNKAFLSDLRAQIGQMTSEELQNLKKSNDMLLNLILSDKSMDSIKKEISKHAEDVQKLAQSNLLLKKELDQIIEKYEQKYIEYQNLKSINDQLSAQESVIVNKMSKQKILQVMDKKIQNADSETKAMEKAYYKGGETKAFLEEYLKKRKEFHSFNMLKVKVMQNYQNIFDKKMNQQLLMEKLEECKHYDKDNRYMATTDLCAEIMKSTVQLEEGMEKRICSAFISHLDDTSLEVQGNAVKCIQKIAPRIRERHLVMIVDKMAERVVEGEKETRDIYSLAIKSIISELNEENAIVMIKAVYPRLVKGLSGSDEVREESLDVLAEIFKRFHSLLLKNQTLVNKDELMRVIPEQLKREKQSLRKKTTNCMGAFSIILNQKQLQQIILLLIDRIKKSGSKQDSFTLIQCIGQITRSVGNKISPYLSELIPLLQKFTSSLNQDNSIDMENEIAEACLSTFENMVRKCHKEIGQFIPSILDLTQKLMTYDPNYTYDESGDTQMADDEEEGGWGSEFEDDNMGQEDDDDTSWKVRRSAVKTVEAVISSRPEILRSMYQKYAKSLVNRFKERDDNVKCNVLETFQSLLKTTIVTEQHQSYELELSHQPSLVRQRSSSDELQEIVPLIIDSLLKELKSKNLKVRVAVMHTLAQLAHTLYSKLGVYYSKMLPEFIKIMNESSSSYDLILDLLTVLRRLFRTNQANVYTYFQAEFDRTLPLIMKALNHEYSKVVSEGLRVAGSFVQVLRGADGSTLDPKFNQVVQLLYGGIHNKLQKTDIDQEVKQCAIIAMANFMSVCHRQLSSNQINDTVTIYNERLQSDLTRDATLKALTKICLNNSAQDCQLINVQNLSTLIPRMFDLLHKAQRSIHLNTLDTLIAMVQRYPQQFNGVAPQIMKELAVFITDADLQTSSLALKLANHTFVVNQSANEIQELIQKASVLARSSLIQGQALNELMSFFATASSIKAVKEQTLHDLYSFVSLQTTSAAKAYAQITVHSLQRQQLQSDILSKVKSGNSADQIKGALCLGEIGKLTDLSPIPNIIDTISALFKSPNEDVRTAASICLGNISIGNTDFFLQRVFALVDKSEASDKQLFLNTIREIIIHNVKCVQAYLGKLLPLLIEHARNDDEQIRNIVAESLGRLYVVYSRDMQLPIDNSFKSANVFERATVIKSFKFAGSKETDPMDLEFSVEPLVKLVQDKDLLVKKNSLEALTTIVHNQSQVVRQEIDKLQKVTIAETTIKPELISEVDLGPFKHKMDEGIPIRKAAYSLIDTLVEKVPEKLDMAVICEVVIKGLDDTAEECMVQCLHIIGRIINWSAPVVVANMDALIESFDKQFTKNIKLISNAQSSEKAMNIMRSILRVVEQLQRTSEAEGSSKFGEFFRCQVNENPQVKEIYQKIAATASQALSGEHF